MKNTIMNFGSKMFLLFLSLFASVYAFAQEEASTTVHKSETTSSSANDAAMWYTNPIVWVVGGLAFVLILVALLRNRKNVSEVSRTTTTTTVRD